MIYFYPNERSRVLALKAAGVRKHHGPAELPLPSVSGISSDRWTPEAQPSKNKYGSPIKTEPAETWRRRRVDEGRRSVITRLLNQSSDAAERSELNIIAQDYYYFF